MRRRWAAVLLALASLASACSQDRPSAGPTAAASASAGLPSPQTTFEHRRALIDMGAESILLDVKVAATPEQRARGLMHRKNLAADDGMVLLWFAETSGPFFMEDTFIPLSVAFFDERGRILEILDMEPCKRDPCRAYNPGVSYWGALQVNQGAFERWGVQPGHVITIPS